MKYQLSDLIGLVSDLIGLKDISKATTMDMVTELQPIQNQSEYIKFIKSRINVVGMEYLPAYQRFIKLTEQYKRQEVENLNRSKIEAIGSVAERLANKVKEIDTLVLNAQYDNHEWSKFKMGGECFFTEKEIKALLTIGSPLRCVRLQRSVSGRDMLAEKLEELFVERVSYPQLEAPKQSNNLIANLATALTVRR
jgi:hypothetical protein